MMPIEDPFKDIIAAQAELERSLYKMVPRETPIYDFGTYQPTYLGGTTPGATTYTTQYGEWRRYNDVIFVAGRLVWTAATGTGNAQISLPSTPVNTADLFGAGSLDITNVTFANGSPSILLQPNVAVFIMRSPITNAGSAVVQMEAAGTLNFSLWYMIAP